ncbi:MAG: EAL domain-containing protein [Alphaproteobacteria bacterium]|nr:EAL domain-containing protein [Alphaproteobacteria bacterium]
MIVLDAQGVVRGFDAAAEALFGVARLDIEGKAAARLLAPGHESALADLNDRGGRRAALCLRGDGTTFTADISAALAEAQGVRLCVLTLCQLGGGCDALESALIQAEERLASITANVPGIVFQRLMAPDGTISYPFFTAGLRDLLGFEPEEVKVNAEGCLHFVHWADRSSHVAMIRHSAAEMDPCVEEFRAITQQGAVRWLRGTSRPHRLAQGVVMWDGLLIDVTDRKQAELRLEMIMDHAADCIITLDEHGRIESVNAAVEALFGYAGPEMIGNSVSMLMPRPHRDQHDAYVSRYLETGEGMIIGQGARELLGQRKDGSIFPLELTTSEVRMEGNRIFIGIGRDVTRRKQTEAALRETELRLGNIAANMPGVVFQRVLKPDGSFAIPYVSDGSRLVMGVEPAELTADPDLFLEMLAPESRSRFLGALSRSAKTFEPLDEELELLARDGQRRWLRGQSRPRRLDGGTTVWDGVLLDVTDRKQVEEQLAYLAYHDPVTKVGNRPLFLDRFAEAREMATGGDRQLGVLSLGIDRFSIINSTLGHSTGDRVLAAAASRLVTLAGPGGLVARIGGDRFLILLTNLTGERELLETAEMIVGSCKEPLPVDAEEFDLTISIGICLWPRDGDDAETLVRNADAALLRAKGTGPGSMQMYSEEMNARAVRTLSLHHRLRRAIDDEELVAYFQPQVDVSTGRVVGMEALARWISPEAGMISPGEFIPVAEEYGLIDAVCEQVLRDACRQNKRWQTLGLAKIPVAVNISGRQFQHARRLVYLLESVLDETELEAAYLELELTESSAMRDADNAIAVVANLREMGFACAIDDFGTGYSSLSVLKRFPIHKLKIDRSFVMDVTNDSNDAAIVNAIIAMAHALKLKVVAEGVETTEHLEFLAHQGCDQIQGYLFSRPLAAADMERLFIEGRTLAVPSIVS